MSAIKSVEVPVGYKFPPSVRFGTCIAVSIYWFFEF